MAHYVIEGEKYRCIMHPTVGEILDAEELVGEDSGRMGTTKQMAFQVFVSLQRYPDAIKQKYNWRYLTREMAYESLAPIKDQDEPAQPEMIPDPTERGARTGESASSESTPNGEQRSGTGSTLTNSPIISGGLPESSGL